MWGVASRRRLIKMKFPLKDEPREWRKSALLTAVGLAILCSVLRWRHILENRAWLILLLLLVLMAVAAVLQPRWFRSYYIFSMRLGFRFSQILGWTLLMLFFFLVLVPMSWVLRLAGKDMLQLKRPSNADTYWQKTEDFSSLDRLF
jgi:hypothetical protein